MARPLIARLYDMSPRQILQRVVARLSGPNTYPPLREVLASPKHTRSQRLYDFLSRYEAILARAINWTSIDFEDREVLEIGAGPVAGWAPLGVFLGSKRYVCVEPYCDPHIMARPELRTYFRHIYNDLSAIYGPRLDEETFLKRLKSRVEIISERVVDLPKIATFDVQVSNSCLEHVTPLDETARHLYKLAKPDCSFLHLIDFGNHQPGKSPFDGLYEAPPATYLAKKDAKVNLLRGPDVLRIFETTGFEVALQPYYTWPHDYRGNIHGYWSSKYTSDELFLKAGILAGHRPAKQ